MSTLREAATMALKALEFAPGYSMRRTDAITALRGALAEEALQRLTDVHQEIEATLAEPVQERAVCDECGKHKRDGWALYCVGCVEPMFAPPRAHGVGNQP